MVWKSLWARVDTAPLLYSDRETANNNQFNYPQNIYCRMGFVMQTQRRRVATTSDFLLHCARPFSRRFVVVIAWFSVCCFTRQSYQCGFAYSGCAAAFIYTYHPDLRWVCHIGCFIFRLLLGAMGLYSFFLSPVWPPCAQQWDHVRIYLDICFVCVCNFPRFSWIESRVRRYNYLCSCLCSSAADAPASDPEKKSTTDQVMTLVELCLFFARTSSLLHLERMIFTNASASPVTHWCRGKLLRTVMKCRHHPKRVQLCF